MRLALNKESVNTIRGFAELIPVAIQNIIDSTLRLINAYQSVSETLGVHRQEFYNMLLLVKKAQSETVESIQVLQTLLNLTADRIDAYIASSPSKSISGKSVGTDGVMHNHKTNITFSNTNSNSSNALSFFGDRESAFEWGTQHYSGWVKELTREQVIAIQRYSGPEYDTLNSALRSGEILNDDLSKLQKDIHSALVKTSIPEDVTIYRAINENALREISLFYCQDDLKEGCSFTESAMMSCSLANDSRFNRSVANKYIFKLTVVSGIHAGYIENISLNQDEHEILVDSNHTIYVSCIKECLRSAITGIPEDNDTITVIDGILTL